MRPNKTLSILVPCIAVVASICAFLTFFISRSILLVSIHPTGVGCIGDKESS